MTDKKTLIAVGDRWSSRDQVILGAVWFEFLLISPSYELARRERAGTLTDADRQRLPADFDVVLSVYDDFGDVQRISRDEWWLAKGIRYFGYQGEQPAVHPIHVLRDNRPNLLQRGVERLTEYLNGPWQKQGSPNSMIVSIPTGLSKAEVIDQVSNLLDGVPEKYRETVLIPAKYEVHGKKHDIDSYFRYLKCLALRAEFPEAKLWEIGVAAELSSTYSARIAKGQGSVEDQQSLKMLTSRQLYRGVMMAENAARGIFPSYQPCAHPVSPEWADMNTLMAERFAWEDEQG